MNVSVNGRLPVLSTYTHVQHFTVWGLFRPVFAEKIEEVSNNVKIHNLLTHKMKSEDVTGSLGLVRVV